MIYFKKEFISIDYKVQFFTITKSYLRKNLAIIIDAPLSMTASHDSKRAANPRNTRKEVVSVIAIKKTPEDIAGSNFILYKSNGIIEPKKPAMKIVKNIAVAKIKLKLRSCFQK